MNAALCTPNELPAVLQPPSSSSPGPSRDETPPDIAHPATDLTETTKHMREPLLNPQPPTSDPSHSTAPVSAQADVPLSDDQAGGEKSSWREKWLGPIKTVCELAEVASEGIPLAGGFIGIAAKLGVMVIEVVEVSLFRPIPRI